MKLSLYQEFVEEWKDCTRCPLHETRKQVVLARGQIPCDILFVGEAPGQSEDIIGLPFVGPAGKLLDCIVKEGLSPWQVPGIEGTGYNSYRVAMCNLICCLPRDETGGKTAQPDPDDILSCAPRLDQFVRLANPRLLVCVGALPEKWIMGTKGKKHLLTWYEGQTLAIVHPAAVLRANVAMRGLMIQKAIVNLRNAVEELDGQNT